ncbi:MAG: transglutaminase-like domain-containing protein [Anaerolineae bacterium]|nr:transglutaminase-like domain-containing protein [Thermoflexales bacterium]MDW8408629.1 transglutaminase-like domain-containing protein [Anaerolineae bacterium]
MSLVQNLLVHLVRRLGGATLLALMLLLVPQGVLALVLTQNIRGLDGDLLMSVTLLALLLSWWLARCSAQGRLRSGWSLTLALAFGLPVVIVRVGGLTAELLALAARSADLYRAFTVPFSDPAPALDALIASLNALLGDVSTLLGRTQSWLIAVAQARPMFDPVAAALVWAYGAWVIAAWSAWAVRRHGNVLLGLALPTSALALTAFYVGEEPRILLVPLGAALAMMIVIGQAARESRWRAAGIDFWEGMRLDMAVSSVPLLTVLLVLSSVIPAISLEAIVTWAQKTFVQPVVEDRPVVPESLGLQPRPRAARPPDNLQAPGLPRRHLIGARPELSRELVMYVNTSDMPAPQAGIPPELYQAEDIPRLYWLGSTYDFYNGSGWSTSNTRIQHYVAGQPLITPTITATQTQRRVRQYFRLMDNPSGVLYAAGVFESADMDYSALWRSFDDLFGIRAPDVMEYRVDSLVSNAPESVLREVRAEYPDWILDRYLQLPDTLPIRVRTLARDLTATAPTLYDRARAIEAHLRTYSYTLDLPPPPLGRDVVDYFLFDLRRGYCDYFATSMVVLARAAGLPARVAVGYATGTYDPRAARYAVVGTDAHSWAQVYFPGHGWIDFEPTSSRPLIERPLESSQRDLSAVPLSAPAEPITAQRMRAEGQRLGGLVVAGLALAAIGVMWFLSDAWRLSRLPPEQVIVRLYNRLHRRGRELCRPAQVSTDAQTPYEFQAVLDKRLRTVLGGSVHQGADSRLEVDRAELRKLVELYVHVRYSSHRPDTTARAAAINAWFTLRRALWWAWLRDRLLRHRLHRLEVGSGKSQRGAAHR